MRARTQPTSTLVATAAIVVLLALGAAACSTGQDDPGAASAGDAAAAEGGDAAGSARLAAVAPTPGQPVSGLEQALTVTGSGRITGTPDTLRATIGVQVLRPQVQEALDVANSTQGEVLAALESAGVAEDDIQTTQFSVEPQYRYEENQPPTVTGYVVTNLVEAKIRDLDRVGETLSAAVEAGGDAARVQGVRFSLEDNAALLAEAREAAYADALQKAEQYAEAAGVELGALVALTEASADLPQPQAFGEEAARASAADAAAPVPVRPGSQEVGVTITASWRL